MTAEPLEPRVIEVDDPAMRLGRGPTPQVFASERTDRIMPAAPAVPAAAPPPRRRAISFGLAGLGVFFAGWLVVDAYWWVAAAFERSALLGALAATATLAGAAGAGAIISREARSLWRLRNVENARARLAGEILTPREARAIINDILAVLPKDRETQAAIEAFQRQVQSHHSVVQQTQILADTVLHLCDSRAESHVRMAALRAASITAISPTALSNVAFFLAVGVLLVRQIAAAFGHRPTATATLHLLRRLTVEAGGLGAVDVALTTLARQLPGARVGGALITAPFAAYRMAQFGIIVMGQCRPVPFRDDDAPSASALVKNVLRDRGTRRRDASAG